MESLYVFLIRNDVWIYIICGLILIWNVSRLAQARRLLRQAIFGLEKERGQRIQRRALIFIVISLVISGFVTYVNLQIAPDIPPDRLKPPTPTPNIFATPLSSPTPLGTIQPQTTATLPIAPTVTLAGQGGSIPQATIPISGTIPGPPVPVATATVVTGSCPPEAIITSPPDGVTVSSFVTFFGTATSENFASYDLQASGPGTNGLWRSLLPNPATESVQDDILGQVDLSLWVPGDYIIRLIVSNDDGTGAGLCLIQLALE